LYRVELADCRLVPVQHRRLIGSHSTRPIKLSCPAANQSFFDLFQRHAKKAASVIASRLLMDVSLLRVTNG
jgi:hypothetical protein